ncbi:12709_t:CDS:2, partial [Acaulospora colombiana]
REVDPVLRLTHLETLLLLCTTKWGRDVERRSGVYEIVRIMHETEEDEKMRHPRTEKSKKSQKPMALGLAEFRMPKRVTRTIKS